MLVAHVRYVETRIWLQGFWGKMAIFLLFHCLAIPGGDLSTKKLYQTKYRRMTRKPRNAERGLL